MMEHPLMVNNPSKGWIIDTSSDVTSINIMVVLSSQDDTMLMIAFGYQSTCMSYHGVNIMHAISMHMMLEVRPVVRIMDPKGPFF